MILTESSELGFELYRAPGTLNMRAKHHMHKPQPKPMAMRLLYLCCLKHCQMLHTHVFTRIGRLHAPKARWKPVLRFTASAISQRSSSSSRRMIRAVRLNSSSKPPHLLLFRGSARPRMNVSSHGWPCRDLSGQLVRINAVGLEAEAA